MMEIVIYDDGSTESQRLIEKAEPLIKAGKAEVVPFRRRENAQWMPYGEYLRCERGFNNMIWAIEHELVHSEF